MDLPGGNNFLSCYSYTLLYFQYISHCNNNRNNGGNILFYRWFINKRFNRCNKSLIEHTGDLHGTLSIRYYR